MTDEDPFVLDSRALDMVTRAETYSGWLTKLKSDSAKAKWLSGSNRRFFTCDFEAQAFYYCHDQQNKKISNPIEFGDIMHAEQLPQGQGNFLKNLGSKGSEHGFVVRTRDREIKLFASNWNEAKRWVETLNTAKAVSTRKTPKGLSKSPSKTSLSTAEGSNSPTQSDLDSGSSDGRNRPAPWAPPPVGHTAPPWSPAGAPPDWAQAGAPQHADPYNKQKVGAGEVPHWAQTGPEPGSKYNLEPPSQADAFAALDALVDELGPVPEAPSSPVKQKKKKVVRNARDIAAMKCPEMAESIPAAPARPAPDAATPPPAKRNMVLPSFDQNMNPLDAHDVSAGYSTASTAAPVAAPSSLCAVSLGSLPAPAHFNIADESPDRLQDDVDNEGIEAASWDSNQRGHDEAPVAFEAEAAATAKAHDDDPWDSEPEETKQPVCGPSEGQMDNTSWDGSDDEGVGKAGKRPVRSLRRPKQDDINDDIDDLIGEVVNGTPSAIPIHQPVPGFSCTKCDFQVLRFAGFEWALDVDYMFFRNFRGKPEKLRAKLNAAKGTSAYCCQCSWKSAASTDSLQVVAEDLRWRCIG